jgi:hypothetical protein
MYGRMDSEVYKRSLRRFENMHGYPQGGAARRGGSEVILDHVLSSTDASSIALASSARAIDFKYSKDEAYVIVFHGASASVGANYFFTIYNPKTGKTSVPFFNGGSGAGYVGDSIGAGAVSANALSSDTTLSEMQYAQNGDTMIFTHQDFPPFYIKRLGQDTFYTADFYRPYDDFVNAQLSTAADALWKHWPFSDLNRTATTFTMGATTGTTTITASTAVFSAGLVGSLFYITNSGILGVAMYTGYTSTTVMDCTVLKTMPGTSAYTTWGISAWSNVRGYPRSVSFKGSRAVYGFTKAEPEKIWFTQLNDIFELSNVRILIPGNTITEDDPGSIGLVSTEANSGQWMRGSSTELLVGTRGREYAITGLGGTLKDIDIKPQTSYGSENVQPAVVDDVPVFVQRGFRKLREMLFDYRTNGYGATDITFYAEHLFRKSQELLGDLYVSKIKQMAYQPLDNNLLWIIDSNGYLYCCTKSRENSVTSFHRHVLGGSYSSGFPQVNSICSVPSSDGTGDNIYMIVKRTVNSATVVTLERIRKEFRGTSLHSNLATRENQPVFMDYAKIFRPVNANFWARLYSTGTATVAGGSTTVTTTGTINYTSKYALATADTSYLSYSGTSNADFAQIGCIRFKLINFTVPVAAANRTILTICKAATDAKNLIQLAIDGHGTSAYGNLILTVKDSAGVAIINGVTLGNLFTTYPGNLTELEFELNYNLTAGATRLFINGKQFGSTISSTGTRDTTIGLIRLNADESGGTSKAGFGYSNLAIYNTVQHTADFEVFEPQQLSTTVRGLEYLEGQTVQVLGDGNYIGDYTVASGIITLPATYSTLIVGLEYTHLLQIQPIDTGTGIGSAMGSIKRVDRAVVRFNDTAAASVGPDEDNVEELVFRDAATPMGDPITLVTDDKVIEFAGDYDRQAAAIVTGSDPLPCNVTCISLRGITADV